MSDAVDTTFDFSSDTPSGRDPDAYSPTLKRYHRALWSKALPSDALLKLTAEPGTYLLGRIGAKTIPLASDAITTNLTGRAAGVIAKVPADTMPPDLGYTIGSAILFPAVRIDGRATLNGARGFHPRIADRFDLTLECIRRHYSGGDSPLREALARYAEFFDLFETFNGYVSFWLLDELVSGGEIRFFHQFADFTTPAVPKTVDDYVRYVEASNAFIAARNERIRMWLSRPPGVQGN